MPQYTVTLSDNPNPHYVKAVRAGLSTYNVKRVPELLNLPQDDIAIFIRDDFGYVQGGVVGEVDWGMLYVDLLWVQDSLRGQGYGARLMHSIEQAALQTGLSHVYLMTTEFQALPFYQHIGYDLFGTLRDRPRGFEYYYLRKMNIQTEKYDDDLSVDFAPRQPDVRAVNHGLRMYCEQFVDCSSQNLSAFVLDDDSEVMGGIVGSTYWDWYDLRYFWVDEALQGQGYGKRLLQMAEEECHRRGMIGIVCDTAEFQALPFYQSQGFEVFATMKDRPPKHESHFLKKLL